MVYQASFSYSSGQMDLPLKTMYDAFKDDICKELGPLDPNWFEVLTAQTSVIEENVADKDDLSANQEGHFKTPLNKTAVDSQLFSTPKVFRHSGVVSPEHSFTTAQEKGSLPWMTIQSPSLFLPSLQGAQDVKSESVKPQIEDSFDLLKTPNKSPISYAKHISESLGAQINCDISWTSSLNTPSAVPSTLILSKSDESPCPVSVTADRNVVFVRKLFPSLSKTSSVEAPKHKDTSSVFQGAISPEVHAFPQSPLRQSGDVWQLGVPDDVEDKEVGALDGAENILSSFFANSSSALRKVKPDRIKRKQIIQTKQNLSSSKDVAAASTEEATSDQESWQLPCTPRLKTADPAVSQWSPLSLSEIPPCALESSITTEQLQDDTRPVQLTRPSVNITNSGFVKKKRTFIYTVSSVKRQGQDKEGQSPKKDPSPGIRDSGQEIKVRQLEKGPGDRRNADQPNQRKADGENISSSGDAKVQDFDMSQLCKDFAQDFSQVPNFGQREKVAKDILNNFSPSACLSVMKQAKQKARQASLLEESDENRNMGQTCSTAEGTVSDSGFQSSAADFTRMTASSILRSENTGQSRQFAATPFPSTNKENVHLDAEAETTLQKSKKNQTLDSGRENESHGERRITQQFNSAGNLDKNDYIPLNSQITESLLEKTLVPLPSGSASGFKTASNKGIHISSANLERAKRLFEDTDGKRTFGIQSIKCDHAVKQNGCQNNESMTSKISNSKQLQCAGDTFRSLSSELTASEQADVTELCSLLEEADSQFEFTQFKTAKLKRHNQNTNTPQQPDKELDPDFLADIDFDDSFSLDNGKHPAVSEIPDEMTSGSEDKPNNGIAETINQYMVLSSSTLTIENSSVAPFSDNISVDKPGLLLTKPNNLSSSEKDIANKMDNSSSLMHCAGFTTARGNVLRVSKKCLSKARALFADLEANLTDQKSNDKQNAKTDAKTEQNLDMCRNDLKLNLKDDCDIGEKIQDSFPKKEDFVRSDQQVLSFGDQGGTRSLKNNKMDEKMLQSGKGNSISAKCMQQANDCFNDCSVMKHGDDTFDKSTKHLAESIKNKSFSEYKNLQVSTSEEHVTGCTESENVNAGPTAQHIKEQHVDKVQMSRNCSQALKNAKPFHGHPFTTSKPFSPLCTSTSIDSSVTAGLNTGDGFCTAGGKKVFVSADAMRRAECLLNYTQTPEDINIRPNQKEPASKSGPCVDEGLKEEKNGFQTASGKEVSISKAALRNAKALLTGCERGEDEVSESLPCSKNQVSVAVPPMRGCGFSAASGKPVVLLSKALQKAKATFSDISLSTDIPTASNSIRSDKKHEDVQDDAEKMHIGFTTAGGAKVHVSQKNLLKAKDLFKELDDLDLTKALQEADAFFKDCDMDGHNRMLAEDIKDKVNLGQLHPNERMRVSVSEEPKHGSIEKTDKQVKQKEEALQQRNDGFQTASGKGVNVSSEALQRAKILLNDCDGVEKKMYTTPLQTKVNALPIKNGGFCSASGKPVTLSSEAVLKAKSLFSDIGMSTEIQNISTTMRSDRKQDSGTKTDRIHCGFTTPQGAKVSASQKPLPKAKHLCQEFDDSASVKALQEDVFCHEETDGITDNHSEILPEHTSETPVSQSLKENLSKCKANQRVTRNFSEESGYKCTQDTNDKVKQQEDICPQQSGGFQTANGKAVTVSSEALTRAQILLSENEGVEDRIHVSKVPVNDTPIWNRGFSAASGKPVAFSSEALLKAKSFFNDIPNLPDTKRSDEKHDIQSHAEKIHSGFTTAGGGKVHVSEKSILKTKNLLRELHDEEHHYSFSTPTSPQNVQKRELSSAKVVEKVSLSTVASSNNGNIPLKRRSPSQGKSMNTTSRLNEPNDIPKQEDSNMLDWDLNETNYSKRCEVLRSEPSSDLNLKSLNLMGCTKTQHRFLAQEALDCTKALLEDEVLAEQSFSVTSKSTPLPDDPKSSNRSAEDKGRMKRLVRDSDLTGQPPSKRRLLEEFDRTVDGPKALHPVKSCPDSLMKDRRVFKYSAALHPNVTKPHGVANMYTDTKFQRTTLPQHSTPGGGRVSPSKMPAFVPPFIKTLRRETLKNPELKENTRTPAFVPPFKKQRTVLQESSSKQQEVVKRQLSFITESNRNTFRSSTDVTSSADPKNQNMTNNDGIPVNCEAVSSGTEALDVNNSFSRIQDKQNIELARDMQDMRIRKKKRQTIRPLPGSLFLTKTSGVARIPLKVAVKGKNPARCSPKQLYEHGVQKHVSEITSETAESFRFSLLQFIKQETIQDGGGVQLADGGWLIPRNDWTAGKEEFYRALCDTPGVDPKLISEPWVYNHYRWIVWKQASMEKSFPETMGSFCLTPEQVLLQLKYRYDVEVDHSRRPALRKIMEKDDTAAKTLILCVCEIVSKGHSPNKRSHNTKTPQSADAMLETSCAVVRLTDGWYAIKAQLDVPLAAMLHKDLLTVGGKLIIHGAQLMGSQDACSPLEAPDSLMLKISANSSRRARWDAKLGFHRDPRPFLLPLSSLYSSGGPVGCVDVVILRSYPIQWMERKADGVVFRSARAEEKEARRFDSQKHKAMETLFAKIQADFEKEGQGDKKPQEKRKSTSHQDIASLQDGEELYEAVGDDLSYFEACLSEQQLETLHAYRRSLMEKKQVELQDRYRRALEVEDSEMSCPKRDVTPVWKLSIADSRVQTSCVYQLNLWRPSSDLQSLLKEGRRYKVYNLVTSDGKKRSGIEAVQLTGTKKTQFQDLQASQEWLENCFQPRVATDFVKLQNAEFQPQCGEVDLTGYVIRVLDEQGSSPAFYLADGMLNFVKVRCFNSLSQAGLEGVVKPGVLLALSNLQLRGQSLHPTPVVYAGDLTVFSANPKEVHQQKSLSQLRNLIQCRDDFFQIAEEKLSHSLKSHTTTSISSPSLQLQTPISDTDRKQDSNTNVTFQKPVRSLGSFTPVSRNPSAATPSSEKDPRHLKRKRALDYLSRIPSPPPLSHLGSSVSPCINKTFNPPRRSGTPSTLKPAQTPIRKPTDSLVEDEWVNDEELAMIDTQALRVGDLL